MDALGQKKRWKMFCFMLPTLLVNPALARAAPPRFAINLFGFTDAEHTFSNGMHLSGPSNYSSERISLLAIGQIRGFSIQWLDDEYGGQSAWISQGSETARIGLYDDEHTRTDGYRVSAVRRENERGQLAGFSSRFTDGIEEAGGSAWFFDGARTRRIGLFDRPEAMSYPASHDSPRILNDHGQVAGGSTNALLWINQVYNWAWVHDPLVGSVQIGLTSDEHTNSLGNSFNFVEGMNNRGQVIGTALRTERDGRLEYTLPKDNQSAWLFDGENTIQLGFTDDLHTGDLGIRSSAPVAITDSGFIAGHSAQFDHQPGCADDRHCLEFASGNTAWVYRDGEYRFVGLTDGRFINEDGTTMSRIRQISESGFVAGTSLDRSDRFAKDYVPWIDDGISTYEIEVPRLDGYKKSSSSADILDLTDQGDVVGTTVYLGDIEEPFEQRVWWQREGQLRLIGLTGDDYRGADGSISNEVLEVIDGKYVVGQVMDRIDGHSTLWVDDGRQSKPLEVEFEHQAPIWPGYGALIGFNDSGQLLGKGVQQLTAEVWEVKHWVHDPAAGLTVIEVPESKMLLPNGITDAGWVYGRIGDGWSENGYFVNEEAFLWHESTGLLRLADLVSDLPLPEGFRLAELVNGMDGRRFAGHGYSDRGRWAFLAVAVPEPTSIVLGALAICGSFALHRKSSS
jgi:hypothetical protein